jgi:hypothetical protein
MARDQEAGRPRRKTPAERSEELLAASRQLKEESAQRRQRASENRVEKPPATPRPKGT